MRYIRINTRDMPRDTARSALRQARRQSNTDDKPTLTQPTRDGFYYAIIQDEAQLRLFTSFLVAHWIKYTDLSSTLPGERVVRKNEPPPTSTDHIDEALKEVTELYHQIREYY